MQMTLWGITVDHTSC